jgi:RimJ/RimL family protein N-acetyltransferase
MRAPSCVGALIRDRRNQVYAHRRTTTRRLLPGIWDIVGGHVEPGETPEQALAREIAEETGWRLRRVEAVIADWEWEHGGVVRRELDYLVEVDGDLGAPRLEPGMHDASAWVGPDNLELMMEGRTDGDRRLLDVVAKAVRIRLTERLRLEPIGPGHAGDLWRLHQDAAVAEWHAGTYGVEHARDRAASMGHAWETAGVSKWMAYDRHDGRLVGRGGLSRMDPADHVTRRTEAALPGGGWAPLRLEVGWTVHSELWGRGYATEIGRAGLAFAFDDLGADVVIAYTERHNARSRAVMERLGMRDLGIIQAPGLVEAQDGMHDLAPFALYAIARTALSGPRGG